MTTAYAIADASPFCETHGRVDDLIKQLTSAEAMRATLGDIERLLAKGPPSSAACQPLTTCVASYPAARGCSVELAEIRRRSISATIRSP